MKRKIAKHGLRTLIISLIIFIVLLWVMKAPVMSMILTNKLRVKVKVGRIVMRPSYTKIHHFKIKNPHGIRKRTAFSTKEIDVKYQFSQLFDNPRVIDEINMEDVFLGIDFINLIGTENNWAEILSNMPKAKGSSKPILIKKLTLKNFKVEIWGKGFNAALKKKVEIPSLTFTNINSEKGFPTEQLVAAIFSSAGIKEYIKHLFTPDSIFEELFAPFSDQGEVQVKEKGSSKEEPLLH